MKYFHVLTSGSTLILKEEVMEFSLENIFREDEVDEPPSSPLFFLTSSRLLQKITIDPTRHCFLKNTPIRQTNREQYIF